MLRFFIGLRKSGKASRGAAEAKLPGNAVLPWRVLYCFYLSSLALAVTLLFPSLAVADIVMDTGGEVMHLENGNRQGPDDGSLSTPPRAPNDPPSSGNQLPWGVVPEIYVPWIPPYQNGQPPHGGGKPPGTRPPVSGEKPKPGTRPPDGGSGGIRPPQWSGPGDGGGVHERKPPYGTSGQRPPAKSRQNVTPRP